MYCPNPSLHDKGISAAEFLESTLLQLLFLVSLEFEFHKIVKTAIMLVATKIHFACYQFPWDSLLHIRFAACF